MNNTIITFSSITYALKARKLLLRADIRSKLVKTESKSSEGCTHGLEISEHQLYGAAAVLRDNGIGYEIKQ